MKGALTMHKVLTVQQMRRCEQLSDEQGRSLAELMDNAGEALARIVTGECIKNGLQSCLILAGSGNNGGDGFVAARIIADSGIDTTVMLCCGEAGTELSKAAFSKMGSGVKVISACSDRQILGSFALIVDCVFGTGFHGALSDEIAELFRNANETQAKRIACDIPSGCSAKSGLADEDSFAADITVTFHKAKLGMLLSPSRYLCGKIITADIGIPESTEDGCPVFVCDDEYAAGLLPERVPYGHKGTFGRLTAVCGSNRYIGAAGISVLGAMRTGVGLCELCTTPKVVRSLSGSIMECIYTELESDSTGSLSQSSAKAILEKTSGANCLLIGCGLGHTAQTEALVAEIIENSECTVVVDADGINSLAANIDVLQKKRSDVILTPHPAELARLCGVSVEQAVQERFELALGLSERYGVTVLAKGAESLAVSPGKCVVIRSGNTALAKGGSGDMLAGMVASLTAQGCDANDACTLASYIMGSTAQMLCEECSPRSLLASDILGAVPRFMKRFEDKISHR